MQKLTKIAVNQAYRSIMKTLLPKEQTWGRSKLRHDEHAPVAMNMRQWHHDEANFTFNTPTMNANTLRSSLKYVYYFTNVSKCSGDVVLGQCFSTFFASRTTLRNKKI